MARRRTRPTGEAKTRRRPPSRYPGVWCQTLGTPLHALPEARWGQGTPRAPCMRSAQALRTTCCSTTAPVCRPHERRRRRSRAHRPEHPLPRRAERTATRRGQRKRASQEQAGTRRWARDQDQLPIGSARGIHGPRPHPGHRRERAITPCCMRISATAGLWEGGPEALHIHAPPASVTCHTAGRDPQARHWWRLRTARPWGHRTACTRSSREPPASPARDSRGRTYP